MATLGEKAVGSIVKLNVDGVATNFIVVHQGLPGTMYDSSCNGSWLLMEDLYGSRTFDSSDKDYENSDIHSYLNNTFVNLFDSDIKSVIKQVKLPYVKGTSSNTTVISGSSGLAAKVFLISYTEAGFSETSNAPVEGAVLSYFNGAEKSKRVAKLNGSATNWWLRSPYRTMPTYVYSVRNTGVAYNAICTNSFGVRPALVLPPEHSVANDGSIYGSVTIGGVQRELTGAGYINIGGVLRDLSDSQVNIGSVLNSLKG